MSTNRWALAVVVIGLSLAPQASRADAGEGHVSLGVSGALSFLRSPVLTYTNPLPQLNAFTPSIEVTSGLGATDWLSFAVGGRLILPVEVSDAGTSIQGFPTGETTYQALILQFPLSVTARYNRGRSLSAGLTLEAGIETARWSVLSSTAQGSPGYAFNIDQTSDWSTSFFLGLQPILEWRHFDHFSFHLGPRVVVTTTGSIHLGAGVGASFIWGVGFF